MRPLSTSSRTTAETAHSIQIKFLEIQLLLEFSVFGFAHLLLTETFSIKSSNAITRQIQI